MASVSDALYRNAKDTNSEETNLNLPAGTYYAKVSGVQNSGDQGEYAFYATPLPIGWQSVDVNRGNTGSGSDIWTNTDSFRYSDQTLTGDGSIAARVDRLDNTATYAKAGVMIRHSTAANAAHVYLGIKPSGELETIARAGSGATAYNVAGTTGQVGPWVRLTRVGNLFTLGGSTDGATWATVGISTVAMTGAVDIGLATCSNNFAAQTTSTFSTVITTGNFGAVTPTYNGLAAPAGPTAAPVAAQGTGIVLNWGDVSGKTGCAVERSPDNSTFTRIATVGAKVTTYTDTARRAMPSIPAARSTAPPPSAAATRRFLPASSAA